MVFSSQNISSVEICGRPDSLVRFGQTDTSLGTRVDEGTSANAQASDLTSLLLKVGCQDLRSIREHKQDFTPVRCHYYVAQCALGTTGRQCVGLRERASAVGRYCVAACESSAATKPSHIVDVTPRQVSAPIKCDDPH